MTLSISTQVAPVGSKLVVDTVANATAKNAVTGGAGSLYQIEVDNAANNDNPAYLKIYNAATATIGTTSPDMVFMVPVSQRRNFVIPEGWNFNYLSFAVVTTGGTAGTTNPTNAVIVRMVTT